MLDTVLASWVNRSVSIGEQILDFFEQRSTRARVWSAVAIEQGGTYYPPRGGFFSRTQPVIEAEIRPAIVRVTTRVEGSGDAQRTYTIVSAPWLLGAGPTLTITRAGVFLKMGRALGLDDAPTGDPVFDEDYIVRTKTPLVVPHVLSARPRRGLRALNQIEVACTASHVELQHPDVVTDVQRLNVAMNAVAEIASHGAKHLEVLRALPGSYFAAQGPYDSRVVPYSEIEQGASRVRAMAVNFERGVYFALRTELHREVRDIVIDFVQGVPEPEPPEGLFDPNTFGTLVSLGNLRLRTSSGAAQLELSGELDADALSRAARWLGGFAQPRSQGAFR